MTDRRSVRPGTFHGGRGATGQQGRADKQQDGGREERAGERERPALALLLAAALVAGGCASRDGSHEPSVVASGEAVAVRPAGSAEPAAFVQRLDGTTVTIEMVRLRGAKPGAPAVWMSRTEIPWDLYDIFLYRLDDESSDDADGISRPSKPYVPPDRGFGHAGYPAIGMTFHAAESFCHWLSVRTGRVYRLPTEAEWSLACGRAAAEADGGGEGTLDDAVWSAANADRTPHPVATKRANALGLHDVLGNVAEWARDAEGKPVACGGSYLDAPASITCEARQRQTPAWNTSDPQIPKSRWWLADCPFVGFRIVCEGEGGGKDE